MCTIALWSNNNVAKVSARNMDWLEDMQTDLWVFPRGMQRTGLVGDNNSLNWTSKYGSVAASVYNIATADGMNEKGLAMHVLWLAESSYGERDPATPGLSMSLWGQFYLDNFASVAEAVEYTKQHPFQLQTATVGTMEKTATVHLQIEDSQGDVAIFEYLDGELNIHHSRDYTVMTNSPPFDQQLENITKYDGFGGSDPLPGTTQANDRFVRASYYLKYLKQPKNTLEAVAGIISVLRNAAQPFVAADPDKPNISPTIWRTVIDHTNMTYYFESTTSPYLVWININNLNFNEDSPILKLPLATNHTLIGESNNALVEATPFVWAMPQSAPSTPSER